MSECVQVVVRARPMNTSERNEKCQEVVAVDTKAASISVGDPNNPKNAPKGFTFDATYDANTIQKNFYDESCSNIIESVLEGFNGTIFAYGQTGCGKSFTMQGKEDSPELRGVIPNAINHIFEYINATNDSGHEFLVRCSYLEIYNEELDDLLNTDLKNPSKCEIKEDPKKGIFVKGLSDVIVENEKEMNVLLERGLTNRHTAATLMNAESSRSHSIFTIIIEMSSKDENGKEQLRQGKLNLVDLAGSERQKKTGASGAQLKEGSKINLSLSALGNVISALADIKGGKSHIPYRDSKLTRLLQDSLGGNTKTLMIAAISPADKNYDETLSTLRYANRAKNITNKPKINEDPKDTMLREHKDEIDRLKKMIADMAAGNKGSTTGGTIDFATSALSDEKPTIDNEQATEALHRTNKLLQEHSYVQDKLKEKEIEIEKERNLRDEMMTRMQLLQSKLAGGESTLPAESSKSAEELEAEAARKAEAKHRAQRRREKREKLKLKLLKIKQEKQALEDQLQLGILQSADGSDRTNMDVVTTAGDQDNFARLEKKMKKKIKQLMLEIDDIKDDARFEKNQLLESISEQAKDLKLYEQICRAVLNEKEFKAATERAQWSEEADEWLLPVIKMKDYKTGKPSKSEGNSYCSGRGGGGSIGAGGEYSGGNQLPSLGGGGLGPTARYSGQDSGRSLLPDINGKGCALPSMVGLTSGSALRVGSSSSRQQYDMEDRLEYNPSMAKLQNLSALTSSTAPKPSTPEKPMKVKSARPAKLKKDDSVKPTDDEYPDDYENEFDDDYAGPISDWGFLVPKDDLADGDPAEGIMLPGKEGGGKKKKKKVSKSSYTNNDDQNRSTGLSLPAI